MEQPSEPSPPPAGTPPVAGSRWLLPRLPVLIGVAGLGAVVTTGSWFKREFDERQRAEIHAIQAEVAELRKEATQFHDRLENLRWHSAKFHSAAEASASAPLKSWLRERARRFDDLVAHVERTADERAFAGRVSAVEDLCRRGEIADAREETMQLDPPRFPSPTVFRELQEEIYGKPLADFSRQNPAYYRALLTYEPEQAKRDMDLLRAQLADADVDVITPQSLLMFELLNAVAPPNDPVVADWSAIASAADYFENPDQPTLKRWREAQQALRLHDWQTAFARMQSITVSTIRTRQPFRAAYGRAILKNRPDDVTTAYPYLQEAAAAGDGDARRWVAQQDLAKERYAEALRWLETGVADGDHTLVPQLLKIYAMDRETVPRDVAREAGMLQRITVAPDAPPLAWTLLGRVYEEGSGATASAEKAFACYAKASSQEDAGAWLERARCHLRGIGTPENLDQARHWAAKAYASGECERSVPMLIELMQRAPDRTAPAVQELFEQEQVASPDGFNEERIGAAGIARLRMQLARHLDRQGSFGAAARMYALSGDTDATAVQRHAELTTVHACEACGGLGKIERSTPCPTCVGKGTVTCRICDGRGFSFVPGSPPCTTCGGAGGIVQDGRRGACSACGGTGKGKGSVIKQTCTQCSQGKSPCNECVGGKIKLQKECPQCHGVGARALADR